MLSDETIDLYTSYDEDDLSQGLSSFPDSRNTDSKMPEYFREQELKINMSSASGNKSSDDEESIVLDLSPQSCATKSSQNLSTPSREEGIFASPRKNLIFDSIEFSFTGRKGKSILPEEKSAEFKEMLDKVNEACTNCRVNEFVLDTIKTKSTSWTQQIKEVTKTSKMHCNIKLCSENDEITNLLGLNEEDIKRHSSKSLISKSAFRDHAFEVLKANVAKLKQQKKFLQDKFGAHSIKVMEGVITRERLEQLEQRQNVEYLMQQADRLLADNHRVAQELATLSINSERQLQAATFTLLRNKALYLQTVISMLKEKLDQSLTTDEDTREKIDSEGDNLKIQVTEMREKYKMLQKTLLQYEKKEATSEKYKKIVVECGKLKTHLDHKYETLKILNDPNFSF